MIISASGHNVRNALAKAREVAGLDLNTSREEMRSGGEDGLYRVHLADGNIVEVTLTPRTKSEAHILY